MKTESEYMISIADTFFRSQAIANQLGETAKEVLEEKEVTINE